MFAFGSWYFGTFGWLYQQVNGKPFHFFVDFIGRKVYQGDSYSQEMKFYCDLWFLLIFCHYLEFFCFIFYRRIAHLMLKKNEKYRKVKTILPSILTLLKSFAIPSRIFLNTYINNVDIPICLYTSMYSFFLSILVFTNCSVTDG